MGQPIPAQHPSVVLRSHFKLVRTLLALAMAAVLALAAAVVILVNDEDQIDTAVQGHPSGAAAADLARHALRRRPRGGHPRRDRIPGRPRRCPPAPSSIAAGAASEYQSLRSTDTSRYDGGPEEGTRGPRRLSSRSAPAARP